jgi:hypothetical protein
MRNWALLIYTYWLDLVGAKSYLAAKSKKAPAPDPAIGQAAAMQSQVAADQLAFSKKQYEDQQAAIKEYMPVAKKLTEGQIAMNDLQMRQALDAENHYNTNFKPLEERFASDAAKAGSQAEQDMASGAAGADVQRQIDVQRDASGRAMASMGVNPNSGRFQGMDRSSQIMGAAAKVGTMNAAAAAEKNRGDQMRLAATQLGRGISGASLAASGASTGTAGGANALGQTGFNMGAQSGAQFMSGMGQAGSMYGQSANTYLGLYGANMQQYSANQANKSSLMGALGGVAGMAMGGGFGGALGAKLFSSDRRVKMNVKRIGTTKDGYPYYSFQYRWGEPSRGVMADEVPASMKVKINDVWHVDYSKVRL